MKTLNENLQKHTLVAALLAAALAGCDGQEAKAPEEAVETPQVAETKPAEQPAPSATPNPAPAAHAPVVQTTPVKPAIVLSKDKSGLVNIAKEKPSKQSSESNTGLSSRAVDGNVDGDFFHSSVTHTKGEKSPWIEIDLGESVKLDHIVIWNRTDCCAERLDGYYIFVSDKPFGEQDTISTLKKEKGITAIKGGVAKPSYTTEKGIGKGRFIRIQLEEKEGPRILSVAEIEAYRAQ